MDRDIIRSTEHYHPMLTRAYIEALLSDPEKADRVWDAWHQHLLSDDAAALAWWLIVALCSSNDSPSHH